MFGLIKEVFITLLNVSGSLAINCISLNNEPRLTRSTLIDLNSNELHYYRFIASLDRCNASCNS